MENTSDSYLSSIKTNQAFFEEYYKKSFVKTEQQKFLEKLLETEKEKTKLQIADVACGGGSLSYHLNSFFSDSQFYLADYNSDAINIAKKMLPFTNFSFFEDDIYRLNNFKKNEYDYVFCWQTLSWLEHPENALNVLLSITKPGGKLYLSSLFNINHDVDVYSKIIDHSNHAEGKTIEANYNTYSQYSIQQWLTGKCKSFKIHPFITPIDFTFSGRGIGTYTINTEQGKIQVSAGMLLNWGVLEIIK